jgi:hypothetical protein
MVAIDRTMDDDEGNRREFWRWEWKIEKLSQTSNPAWNCGVGEGRGEWMLIVGQYPNAK